MPRFLRNPWFLLGLGLWQLVVVFTPVSLYGFWTDGLVFLVWVSWVVFLAMSGELRPAWLNAIGPAMLGLALAVPFLIIGSLGGMFIAFELAGARSVPQADKLRGVLLVNQYFIPTGAYGCGQGRLITAKAFLLFPLVEYRTDYEPCVHDDFGCYIEHGSWEACGY
jgi:hypothetical protein